MLLKKNIKPQESTEMLLGMDFLDVENASIISRN